MQIKFIPAGALLCIECNNVLYFIADRRSDGIKIVKCVNPECKNKGKVCKINPQIIEVEECVIPATGEV